ncbi:MAG: hypothetical protein O3B87_04485 [bacterium]|nr:hypothetical protein [bacterium]
MGIPQEQLFLHDLYGRGLGRMAELRYNSATGIEAINMGARFDEHHIPFQEIRDNVAYWTGGISKGIHSHPEEFYLKQPWFIGLPEEPNLFEDFANNIAYVMDPQVGFDDISKKRALISAFLQAIDIGRRLQDRDWGILLPDGVQFHHGVEANMTLKAKDIEVPVRLWRPPESENSLIPRVNIFRQRNRITTTTSTYIYVTLRPPCSAKYHTHELVLVSSETNSYIR